MSAFASLESKIIDLVGSHCQQQMTDFPKIESKTNMKNAMGMASLDLLTSQTMQSDVLLRNEMQKEVGDLDTFWNGESINDLRKKKKARKRKSNPLVSMAHKPLPLNVATPTPSPKKKKQLVKNADTNNRMYRNGLFEEILELSSDSDDDKEINELKNEMGKEVEKVNDIAVELNNSHVSEVKQLLLTGTENSPADKYSFLAFSKVAKKDMVAIDVLATTSSMNITPNEAKKMLLNVVAPPTPMK